ncbi:hypothetical protein DW787_07410 [Collinsella intestinalis]|uniref:Uncharacterized protein n=1 Tax=Collinsella intestinalis TaxID=147207 RepID=A0A414FUE6_9ACTN|nr:hypothetical protein DW787_07410 [Collinsella intestinalis]
MSPDERPAARVSPADGQAGRKGSARIARLERAMGFTWQFNGAQAPFLFYGAGRSEARRRHLDILIE